MKKYDDFEKLCISSVIMMLIVNAIWAFYPNIFTYSILLGLTIGTIISITVELIDISRNID